MKSRIMIGISSVIAVLLMVFTLTGCGDSLIGKWRSTSEKGTQLVFVSTGKVTMSADDIELTGTFSDDGQNLVMSLTAPNGEKYIIEAAYTITDDELRLENSKGQVEIFVR